MDDLSEKTEISYLTSSGICPSMQPSSLPPPPSFRMWKGGEMTLSSFYSIAGISTSFFLGTPEGMMVLEAGDGCVRDLIEIQRVQMGQGFPHPLMGGGRPDDGPLAIVISHPHYDHYSGLLNLLSFLHLLRRKGRIMVLYPEGAAAVEGMVDHFLDTIWEGPEFTLDMVPLHGGGQVDIINGVSLRYVQVPHRNSRPGSVGGPVPSMAYKVVRGAESVAYSGDTGDAGMLKELMSGASLALIEATYPEPSVDGVGVHLTLEEAGSLGGYAKEHWLVHFTAASFDRHHHP